MSKKYLILFFLFFLFFSNVFAVTTLPNGEAPVCMQLTSGNFDLLVNDSDLNRIDLTKVNCVNIDLRAGDSGWVWRGWSDTNFDTYDYIINRIYNNYGLYTILQPVWTGTGYLPTWIDNNAGWKLNRARYQNNFPNASPTYTELPNEPSIWDENYIYVQTQWLTLVSEHYKSNPRVAGWVNVPNEGFDHATNDVNGIGGDLNRYWHTWLTNRYGTVAQLNAAWTTSYSAITDANVPTTQTLPQQMRDWWNAKSDRIIQIFVAGEQTLLDANSSKIIFSVKALPDYLYTIDNSGYMTFRESIDVNKYWSTTPAHMLSVDLYPDDSNVQRELVITDLRLSMAKAIADRAGKPIYLAELYPTVNNGDAEGSADYFAQLINLVLAYVGSTNTTGVRAINYYAWNALGGTLDIKDTNSEQMVTNVTPYVKFQLKYGLHDANKAIALYDNLTENVIYNDPYYRIVQPAWALIHSTKQYSNEPTNWFYDNAIPTSTTKVVLFNNINYKVQNFLDINAWINSGGMGIFNYRNFEEDENHRSSFGNAANISAGVKGLFGNNITSQQGNKFFAAIVGATTPFISVPQDQNIFRNASSPDQNGDYVTGSIRADATAEATLVGGTDPMLATKAQESGFSAYFGFNLAQTFAVSGAGVNVDSANFNTAIKDLLQKNGVTLSTSSSYSNFYVWDTNKYAVINAYGTTTQTTTLVGGTDYFVQKSDGNTITLTSIPSTPQAYVYTPALTTKQTIAILKGQIKVNTNTGSSTSSMYIDGNLYTNTLPVAITTNTNTSVVIDSNIQGSFDDVNVLFTSHGGKIQSIRFINADRDVNTLFTSGWTADGNNIYFDVNGIEDTNATHKNTFEITLDYNSPVTTISGNTFATWTKTNQTITLTCLDTNGAGCASTTYRIDGGATQVYGAPFVISTDANHTIDYNSIDTLGNTETVKRSYAAVDKTKPVITSDYDGLTHYLAFEITLTCNDATSGCDNIYYSIDGDANHLYSAPILFGAAGTYVLGFFAQDNADNNSVLQTQTVTLEALTASSGAVCAETIVNVFSTFGLIPIFVLAFIAALAFPILFGLGNKAPNLSEVQKPLDQFQLLIIGLVIILITMIILGVMAALMPC